MLRGGGCGGPPDPRVRNPTERNPLHLPPERWAACQAATWRSRAEETPRTSSGGGIGHDARSLPRRLSYFYTSCRSFKIHVLRSYVLDTGRPPAFDIRSAFPSEVDAGSGVEHMTGAGSTCSEPPLG